LLKVYPSNKDLKSPKSILYVHGVYKGLQAGKVQLNPGSVLGLASGSIYSLIAKKQFVRTAAKGAGVGAVP
jgi:hypothetical protein